ncbi:GNAT family N-acetyltransferase [Vibrio sp. LaRot3]|uniref:GNAT family N-acetyltransferase n=1 Tax=Vibrio sp. LaRot3 TaxID=2998829 RepID=UPI0022CE080D|nr:GNAT family N-acetyltransferase [Vibrio sp. LaRot3]MDA0147643.1 GNAT family N-acetyltransferase [Vibrio sp. LaRot3]
MLLKYIELKPLEINDAKMLLEFELTNQSWFETHISPREADFYNLTGVQIHIANLLLDKQLGLGAPYLLIDQHKQILGRVNLSNIDRRSGKAFLGYRIGERFTGQGVAKQGVALLIEQSRLLNLSRLVAIASVENIGSQRVLSYHDFKQKKRLTCFTHVQGSNLDCFEYWLDL